MIPKFIFVAAIILVIVFFAYMFVFKNVKTETMEREIFLNRLLFSPDALAYYDAETGRSYLGIVDINKLNAEHLERGINFTNNYFFAANLTLRGRDVDLEAVYHQNLYEKLQPLALAKIKGPGGADHMIKEYQLSYYNEDGLLKPLTLRVELMRARS